MILAKAAAVLASFIVASCAVGQRSTPVSQAGTGQFKKSTLQKCERDACNRLALALRDELKSVDLSDEFNRKGFNCGVAADAIDAERRHLKWISSQPTQITKSATLRDLMITASKGNPVCRIAARYSYHSKTGQFIRIVAAPKVEIRNFGQFQDSQSNAH